MRHICLAVALSIAVCCIPQTSKAATILLSNDDGYQSKNLLALYAALKTQGHDVVVCAPKEDKSGSSASTARGPFEVGEDGDLGVHYIDGTPVDAVFYGIDVLLEGKTPDLVVSGPNRGRNLGKATIISGTVGGALVASRFRSVPSIAINADRRDTDAKRIADIAVAIVDTHLSLLERKAVSRTLVLNVNIPNPANIRGVKLTEVGTFSGFRGRMQIGDTPGVAKVIVEPVAPDAEADERSEGVANLRGYVTVSPMDGDYSTPSIKVPQTAPDSFHKAISRFVRAQ